MMKKIINLVLAMWVIGGAFAQSISDNNWIYGPNGNGIRFNFSDNQATAVNGFQPMGIGGSAVATNPFDGSILFYTNGNSVFDANNNQMPNGNGLNAASGSAQPVAIAAVPGTQDQYYIFTNTATPAAPGSISYSVVDMSQFGNAVFPLPPLGDVTLRNQVVDAVLSNVAQGMIVVPNANCDGFWLIAQESGTDAYHVLEIDASGFVGITTYGGIGLPIEAASLTYHQGTNRIAVAPEDTENNVVILDFDPATGALSLLASVLNTGRMTTVDEAVYDTEWSVNGNYLYVSIIGEAGIAADLLQYDVINPTNSLRPVGPASLFRSYGLKMAPDSSIYHLYQAVNGGPYLMGRLSETDSVAELTRYDVSPFGVANYGGKNFSVSLPDFDSGISASISATGNCANSPTLFSAEVEPGVDSVQWNLGDGTSSDLLSPVHTYTSGGSFPVSLTTWFNGKDSTFTSNVTITNFNLQVNVVQDTVGCKCEFPINSTEPECAGATDFMTITADISGGTPTSILWSNGDVGATLTPDSAGYYYVVVTDASGCSAYAGVNVREYGELDQRSNYWYFGQNAGINFNPLPDNPAIALDDGAMNAPEGSSSVSNRNGDLIFYTDGDRLWDKNHVELASGIGGDPGATQSVLIVPFPGDETLYYIFTTQEIYGTGTYEVRYSIFDVKQRNGDGDLVDSGVLLFSGSTERLASNGNWLLVHEYGTSNFRAYPLTASGIGVPTITDIGSIHSFNTAENGQGQMKFSSSGKVAVALSDPGSYNYIELFDFVDSTGVLTNYQQIQLSQNTGQVYGIEFSPGGNKIFATVTGGSSEIFEYFIDSLGVAYFRNNISVGDELGSIQIGPDGQIYVAVNGSSSLGSIIVQEDTTLNSTYNPNGFALAGGTSSTLGLPSFIQQIANPLQTPTISFAGVCFGSPTEFMVTGTDIIDEFAWSFGDGTSATGEMVSHQYASPGTYNVAVTITNRCGLNLVLTEQVTISDVPAVPTTPLSTNICSTPITLTAADPVDPQFGEYTYLWSTGETTNQISVDQQSLVSVTITNAAGCTSFRQTYVADNRPTVDFGIDQTVCQNQTVLPLDAGNTGATFAWTLNGAPSGNGQTQSVDTSVPGVFTFEVTVTDPLTNCVTTEDIVYTVEELPVIVVTPTPSPGCGNNNGSITIDISTTGSYSYFINGPTFVNDINQIGPITGITQTALPIGTYFVTVLDEVSQCQVTQSVVIADGAVAMVIPTPTSEPGCTTVGVRFDIQAGTYDGTSGFQYQLTNLDNTNVTTGNLTGTPPFVTDPVIPGNYTLTVLDVATNCTQTVGPFVVVESTNATLTIDPVDECADNITITAQSDATDPVYDWTGPNGYTGLGQTISPPETGMYYVTVSDNTLNRCPTTDSTFVFVNYFEPVINILGDRCTGSVTLDVQPAGANYSYLWTGPSTGGQQLVVGPAESGTYSVQVRDQNTGCIKTSEPVTVEVIDPISIAIASTLPCDNGEPFILTATVTPGASLQWYRNGLVLSGETNVTLEADQAGIYLLEASNSGCVVTEEVSIALLPVIDPELPNRIAICDDPDNPNPETASFFFEPQGTYIDAQWRRDGTLVSTDINYLAEQSGTYTVDLVNAFGCPTTDETLVVTECDPIINAPNAFSPNGNAQNEEFFIFTTFVSDEFEIKLYNRWGEIVFQSNDKEFRWNGRYNNSGDLLPGGTYVYIIKYTSEYQPERGIQERRGGVLLLR